jgi:hypothetical protein
MFEVQAETVFTTFYTLRISEEDALAALGDASALQGALRRALFDNGVSAAKEKKGGAPGKGKARAKASPGWTCPVCGKQLKAPGQHMKKHEKGQPESVLDDVSDALA